MTLWGPVIIGLGYVLGLLSTGILLGPSSQPMVSYGLALVGLGCSLWIPKIWRLGPTRYQWLIAGLVSLLGAAYCLWRIPQPGMDDVSRYAPGSYSAYGEVVALPQVNRSGKGKFWLETHGIQHRAEDADFVSRRPVSGKLYITAPLAQTANLYPGQAIKATGRLYEPSVASKPGEFDFRAYLARQGSFAGLSANYIDSQPNTDQPQRGLWQVRQRIVKAQGRWLGDKGTLVSAMVLGRRAVDLPYDIRDAFITAGLAHTLAASGFHVALILGLVLAMMQWQPARTQAIGGSVALLIYVGLTGLQPSVMRAAIMGFGAMMGLALERQVKPLAALGLAVVLLLLWNPRWIWDIGFQLSVTATLGLMVMATALIKRLDWMPGAIATLLSVPIAAYLWTLPLQLYHFGIIPSYSIILNAIATPLVTLISLGGFISAMASVIWPLAGSAISWLLAIPVQLLITLVNLFNQLPGNQIDIGNISVWLVVAIYSLYGTITLWLACRNRTV
ncbi:ComEC family competence protein [Leptolyngbya cf. ectocarpi LEGE 11479]|uniref:ComEC family competence protein n=1 Tax=Leptolyngbya cf. ectocarpi LEGE 11479 TaxID=1828722 RepID=A0A928ZY64_LEPEC|nr:ComEC/Rec2 family competence protein [Leptolyngbya ectocarpi]MBE9069598.1 ComEC family competence protein [Leptolyngbya cf. ectocarpi LEGE 11479]